MHIYKSHTLQVTIIIYSRISLCYFAEPVTNLMGVLLFAIRITIDLTEEK